jgi:hypothetical protein
MRLRRHELPHGDAGVVQRTVDGGFGSMHANVKRAVARFGNVGRGLATLLPITDPAYLDLLSRYHPGIQQFGAHGARALLP